MAKKQKLDKEFALRLVKAGNKASKELGMLPKRKPHK